MHDGTTTATTTATTDPLAHLTFEEAVAMLFDELGKAQWKQTYVRMPHVFHEYFDTRYRTLKNNWPIFYSQMKQYAFDPEMARNPDQAKQMRAELPLVMARFRAAAKLGQQSVKEEGEAFKLEQMNRHLMPVVDRLEEKRLAGKP